MSRKSDLVATWLPKSFHKKVKLEAVKQDKSMADYLRDVAGREETVKEIFEKASRKERGGRGGIDFGF